ncbi:MAG: NAD(P)-dependent oxidoreductase [Chloroflexota bacterium]|nr:MAG: NAD(P)-dependent oxidoreductase [Chloroflexota bacterium]
MSLRGKRILVTGATGFIGRSLALRLAGEEGARVTGASRRPELAGPLAEAGVAYKSLDMADFDSLDRALEGQEIVFNLAVAPGTSTEELAQRVNIDAVQHLVRQAATVGVKRIVHFSSMAAYGPPGAPIVTEDLALDTEQAALYGRTKALGDIRARQVAEEIGQELTVIRPGMVFGPRGRSWTVNLFKLVKRGVPAIFGDGTGHAQPIYVENLIDGLILAADRPEAAGQAFNFVDQPLPWRDFLGYYGAMCGRQPRRLPLGLARIALTLVKPFIGRTESTGALLAYYTNNSVYPTTGAEQSLGYRRRFSVEEGMAHTEAWLRESGYL